MTAKQPATRKQQVTPLVDILSAEFAKQYELGMWWSMYGDEQGKGPVFASYLVTNLKSYVERGCFNRHDGYWLEHIGFFLGMYHGGVLLPSTGQLRPNVTTSLTLTTKTLYAVMTLAESGILSRQNPTDVDGQRARSLHG